MSLSQEKIKLLVEKAREIQKRAYCPYSNFAVGAAVLTDSGNIFTGANVENASYGLTICAERIALAKAKIETNSPLKAIALYAPLTNDHLTTPCGACLQVMVELSSDRELYIICSGPGIEKIYKLKDFLPFPFRLKK